MVGGLGCCPLAQPANTRVEQQRELGACGGGCAEGLCVKVSGLVGVAGEREACLLENNVARALSQTQTPDSKTQLSDSGL